MGVAGTGMSALAQFLKGMGKEVSGSDRFFKEGEYNETREKLERCGIRCHPQDGSGMDGSFDCVVATTAVEDSVPEMVKARALGMPVLRRSELLAMITESFRTIAVGGTSGKSTTTAMIYEILCHAGLEPSVISGAGLVRLIEQGLIGNAAVGSGGWLVIEADESDGSIVQYHPAIGLLLNIDKDHKDLDALERIFITFRENSERFCVNAGQPMASRLSKLPSDDFGCIPGGTVGYAATDFVQTGLGIDFRVNGVPFHLEAIGRHSMENALAAVTAASLAGVPLETSAEALAGYRGIHRRHQVIGSSHGVLLIDDYAHNPVKCARSIQACQPLADRVIAWFQPHGYGPTKFLRADFVREIADVLRPGDQIWMSEIFYAGGTAVKDISAADLIEDLRDRGADAHFVEDRNLLADSVLPHLGRGGVLLLMGARDPSLEDFSRQVWRRLQSLLSHTEG